MRIPVNVKRLRSFFVGVILLGPITTLQAYITDTVFGLHPYIGADIYQRQLKLLPNYGKGMFKTPITQNNVFAGINFNEYFGIEGGQLWSRNKGKTVFSTEGSILFGKMIVNGGNGTAFFVSEDKIQLNGTHLNLVLKYPINHSNFGVMGSIGVISLKVKAEHKVVADEFGILTADALSESVRKFSSRRAIPKVAAGLTYQAWEIVGLRALVGYENTAKFKNIAAKTLTGVPAVERMSLKNNFMMGLGITLNYK